MAEATLRTSAVLLVSGAIAFGLRGGPATLRHLVWALALVGVLLAPVGATYLSAIDLPVPSFSSALTPVVVSGRRTPDVAMRDRSPISIRLATNTPVPGVAPTGPIAAPPTVPFVDAVHPATPGIAPQGLTPTQIWSFAAFDLWLVGAVALGRVEQLRLDESSHP